MEVERRARWNYSLCRFLVLMTVLGLAGPGKATVSETVPTSESPKSRCGDQGPENRSLLLVSTLDGKMSALNLEKDGQLEWSVDAGAMPLLSSSISKLEVVRNGKPTRLVPSLDGSLFQFDGESIEALPLTADTLLSSSFKLSQDSTIVGGKEAITYGIELRTGKIRYICTVEGCSTFDAEGTTDAEDVIVLTRHTKTIRAVEMRTGVEKWNFSVGQHDVSMVPKPEHLKHLESMQKDGNDAFIQTCDESSEYDEDDWLEYLGQSWFAEDYTAFHDLDLKVIVPQGLVVAMSQSDPSKIMWRYKFKSPIANAWTLHDRELTPVSLFDDKVVPALQEDRTDEDDTLPGGPAEPMLYIGMHEKQIYVQPSVRLTEEVKGTMAASNSRDKLISMPRVRWHPYIATAPSRTPAISRYHPLLAMSEDKNEESGLAVWQSQYPFDNGWYLMSDTSPVNLNPEGNGENITTFYTEITGSLWIWWREVVAISIVTSVLMNIIIVKFFQRKQIVYEMSLSKSKSHTESEPQKSRDMEWTETQSPLPPKEETKFEYISRFQAEFNSNECLGRGGFGVVFEAVNKMDDCSYAVKRVTLNNSERAREKVMREVKALAKLEHTGIVRYYQAWFENPPAGWQERQDTLYLDMSSTTPTPVYTETGPPHIAHSKKETTNLRSEPNLLSKVIEHDPGKMSSNDMLIGGGDAGNPLKVFGGLDQWTSTGDTFSDISGSGSKKMNGSEGFLPKLDRDEFEESGSYSIGFGTPKQKGLLESSVTMQSEITDDSLSESRSDRKDIPFTDYNACTNEKNPLEEDTNDSFNIVFEDSGCNEDPSGDNSLEKIRDNCWTEAEKDPSVNSSHSSSVAFTLNTLGKSSASRPNSLDVVNKPQSDPLPPGIDDPKGRVDPAAPKLYLYIQMQLCRRESLKDWLNAKTLSRDRKELLDIFDQIVSAVDYIHDSGLMHRDLKPSNIFFSMDGSVKVGDFGLVTTLEENSSAVVHTPLQTVNHTGQVGTKLYMSPEQATGRGYNHKVDIYSLGLIFFELFFPFATQMERIKTLIDVRKSVFPLRFSRELPDECNFVKSMLDLRPDRRPSTKEIQQNPLLHDFEAARQSISRIRPRTRTTSSSGSGNSLSSSQ